MKRNNSAADDTPKMQESATGRWSLVFSGLGLVLTLGTAVGVFAYKNAQTDGLIQKVNQLQAQLDKANTALESAHERLEKRANFVAEFDNLERQKEALDSQLTPEALQMVDMSAVDQIVTPAVAHFRFVVGQRDEVGKLIQARMEHCPD